MRIFLFFLFIAITGSPAIGQDKVLFSEDFKNNKNGWRVQKDSSFSVEITNGVLRMEKFITNKIDRNCLWYHREIKGLNTLQNFSITMVAKFVSGGDILEWLDLQWGTWDKDLRSEVTGIYQLNFFLKGDVKLDYFNQGWNYSLRKQAKEMLDKNLFVPNQFNKYEIIQEDGFVIFKINDQLFFKQFASPIKGNAIGIQGCIKSVWEIDKIVVRQLKKKEMQPLAESKFPPVPDSLVTSGPARGDVLTVFPNPFTNEFTVAVETNKTGKATLELFDIKGNFLLGYDRKLEPGSHSMRMYADVTPGSYVLKLTVNDKVTSTKIVKL
jgi:hypothetical protein